MLSIGTFAQIGQVTHRQLRHWDAAGLLVPAHVDATTGHRSYDPSQLRQLHKIVALRRLNFSMSDIAAMLGEEVSTEFLAQRLRARRAEVEREQRVAEARLVDVERRLHLLETEKTTSPIEYIEKPLPALRLAAHSALLPEQPDIAGFVGPAFDAVSNIIGDVPGALDHPVALYESTESGMRVTVGYTYDGQPRAGFEIVTVPAVVTALCAVHLGSMDRIGTTWQQLHTAIVERGFIPSAACREVYIRAYPDDQADWVTELQQPIELPPRAGR
ncbi:MerR family transcriptional regulator [Buchananella hordeovulneris]|uniref:MerR family transcriptional regulator n=1 Tax=Buchananella hordeovulneris TaxID=52770 RepID=A0A1Q5PTG2_9ACTO|nr:MerR family transcriptional regulator [Buchananella hordeovulneris]OKL50745.1 MerR family transcriptional regulator [Buchananella hordeovulneris]RRD42030.1 MerR family transcriptional regulator [Buchananella hordeovulneris]